MPGKNVWPRNDEHAAEGRCGTYGNRQIVAGKKNRKINGLNPTNSRKPLRKHTEEALDRYFKSLNGDRPGDLYDLVIGEVEGPLLKAVMDYTQGNQSQAAGILGINRGTLRKKLKTYSLIS